MALEVCLRREQGPCVLSSVSKHDGELVSVVCRACGGADETIAHIVTECPQLSPSSSNTDLTAALGFVDTGDVVDYASVRRSKTRLEQWRKITLRGLREGS
ncbi:hypothetical protein MRX96_046130 [Rhipicephalus microplus]